MQPPSVTFLTVDSVYFESLPTFPMRTLYVYCPDQPTNRVKAATADFDPEVAIRELQAILNWDNKYKSMGAFIGFEVSSVSDKQC